VINLKPSIKELKLMANKLRIHSIKETTASNSGHPTSCMSCADILSPLFFSEFEKNDEFILSKGHAVPILWAVYAEAGLIKEKELLNLRKIDSVLEGHPTKRMPMIKIATGSLGQGLSSGVGMALAKKLKKDDGIVYVLQGDGESAEGSVWEAANTASYYKLNNLCLIIDVNRLGQSQETMHNHKVNSYKKKLKAFGWDVITINGHNIKQVITALKTAKNSKKPFAIIAKTKKGKGVKQVENKQGFHGKPFNKEDAEKAILEIGETDIKLKSELTFQKRTLPQINNVQLNKYKLGEKIATRAAFGRALLKIGKNNKSVVAIDGDVRNSTMTNYFFDKFQDRSFESFIAEQNMVGMAMGLSSQGLIPFASTFATFFTRAHDFIRMAQYSNVDINLVGSHIGVSIGPDGPSQMGLEDISMFISIPDSVVLCPSDGVSAEKLTLEMAKNPGINYMRTLREKTPTIYNNNESFKFGGLKVLKKSNKDKVLVIGYGVTVHESLKAHEELQKQNINIRVIDLYSIKPIDETTLIKNAKECNNKVILVEDHYEGGASTLVTKAIGKIHHLYIKSTPRSGAPEELRKMFKIDANAIINEVKSIK
jgi:transketolase